jgi:Rrf2 family protein
MSMKLSTKGRYGLRTILDLAVHSNGGHVPISLIAERQGISVSYLEHLFSLLRKAGLIRSVKGAQGGYMLGRPAERMRVGDVLRALEGELTLVEEELDSAPEMDALSRCIREMVWEPMDLRINVLVDGITLEELAQEKRVMDGMTEPMYHI